MDSFIDGVKVGMAIENLINKIEKLPQSMTVEYLTDWYLKNANVEVLEELKTVHLVELATNCCGKTIIRKRGWI